MKNAGVFVAVAVVLGLVGVSPAVAADELPANHRVAKPKVLCMKYKTQRLFVASRPANCDFIDANADLDAFSSWALFPTRSVRWGHWGGSSALGRGKYFLRGVGWRPAKVRLSRPSSACGYRAFTRVRVRVNVPGEGWLGWGRKVPIMACD